MVKAENISFNVAGKRLLEETTLLFESGRFHVIMGANGAGKSTLLKLLAGHTKPASGRIFINETPLHHFSKQQLAQQRAVLSQHYHVAFPLSVSDFVLMGRYPYYGTTPSTTDRAICKSAMQRLQVEAFAQRDYNTLSGGEAQKVQMSRVLAQVWPEEKITKKILFLDEPVSHLDLKYQHQLLYVAKGLCVQGITIIAVLHDINLALTFADRILFMKNGAVCYDLHQPYSVTPEMIQAIFDIQPQILRAPQSEKPIIVF